MSDPTPTSNRCRVQRAAAGPVPSRPNRTYENWPLSTKFTAPILFKPGTLAQLANAILEAEQAGHHVRAYGSTWSFSDAVIANTEARPGAMIATDDLDAALGDLPFILARGVDLTHLHHVEAGMKATHLTDFLAQQGQMLEAGGASGQSVAGMMSTSTHSADSSVPPFVEYLRAIHLVGTGGIEHWLERDDPITDSAKLQAFYPCLASGNIHYDTELFNAVLVSAGCMGVIYSVILEAVPIYAVLQHRHPTTWEQLLEDDPDLSKVIDGSYMKTLGELPAFVSEGGPGRVPAIPRVDILGRSIAKEAPFEPNTFAQIVINPYPLYGNDGTLTSEERARVGEHLCFVTNRVKLPEVPESPPDPPKSEKPDEIAKGMLNAAFWSLGGIWNPDALTRFHNFQSGAGQYKDLSEAAAAAVDFLADYWPPATISATLHYVLNAILPTPDRWDVNLSEVLSWGDRIRGFGMEAAFPIAGAIEYVRNVLDLVKTYAARRPQAFVGGYLALRITGKSTDALLGMQRWSPTCHVEYIGVAGTRDLVEFVDDLQRLALLSGGILHLGLENDVMTATDLEAAHGRDRIDAFRRARGVLLGCDEPRTFDNGFTERLGLTALCGQQDISYLVPLLLATDEEARAKDDDTSADEAVEELELK